MTGCLFEGILSCTLYLPYVFVRNDAKKPPSALVALMPQLRIQMVLRLGDPVEQSLFEDTRYDGQQNNAKCPFRGGAFWLDKGHLC